MVFGLLFPVAILSRSRDDAWEFWDGKRASVMVRDSRRDGGNSAVFIIALCASLAVVLAILFNFVRSDPPGYELSGSVSKKEPNSPLPK